MRMGEIMNAWLVYSEEVSRASDRAVYLSEHTSLIIYTLGKVTRKSHGVKTLFCGCCLNSFLIVT
jgi:hypothetical protein